MSTYDPSHTALLLRETDNAGTLVTHQERALRNQLQLADDEVTRLRRELVRLRTTEEDLR
jgi:hypothetical protein